MKRTKNISYLEPLLTTGLSFAETFEEIRVFFAFFYSSGLIESGASEVLELEWIEALRGD